MTNRSRSRRKSCLCSQPAGAAGGTAEADSAALRRTYEALVAEGVDYYKLDSCFLNEFAVEPVSRFPARIELQFDVMAGYEGHDEFGDFRELVFATATKLFGWDAEQIIPWLNLKAESHINRVKLGWIWMEDQSVKPAIELL